MRRDVGLLGLLLAMTLVGWLLRGGSGHVPAQPLVVDSPGVVLGETTPDQLPWPQPPQAVPLGRATRTEGDGWDTTQALYTVPERWETVADWYATELPAARRLGSPDSALFTQEDDGLVLTIRVYAEGETTRVMCLARSEHAAPAG